MRKSISTWSFPAAMTLDEKAALAHEAGFEGFEVDLSEDGPVTPHSTATHVSEVRKKIAGHGLVISGLASGLYWGVNPVSDDPDVRSNADFILRRQIECAHDLEVDAILVVPGMVGADFIPDAPPVSYDVAYDRARAFVEKALPVAENLGVTIGIENVWNKFLLSPLEMRGFIDSFGSNRVASYFDVGNAVAAGYPEHWIRILGHRIARVHFKDYRRNVGSVDGFVDLLSGDTNWPAVLESLRAIDYEGWVAAEMIPPVPFYRHAPHVLIHNTARAMDEIFKL